MMDMKYLLYIDILGFTELVSSGEGRINRLYKVIDSLNVHSHPSFRTIVFSDTILVYNSFGPGDLREEDHNYCVMYLIEFAQDLQKRLVGSDIYFRAQIRYDHFCHYELTNAQCFYGTGLIKSYNYEKSIPAIGVFIDQHCSAYNRIFPAERFSEEMNFVYINQSFERLSIDTNGVLPIDAFFLHDTEDLIYILWDLEYLKSIHSHSYDIANPIVRTKYLNTLHLFRLRYRRIIDALIENNFSLSTICPSFDWGNMVERFNSELNMARF